MCVCTRKECPFVASDAIPSNSSDKGSQKKLNKRIPLRLFRPRHHNPPGTRPAPENRLAPGSVTRKTASHWGLALT